MTYTLERRTGQIAVTLGVIWLFVCAGCGIFGLWAWSVALVVAFRGVLVVMGLAALALLGGFVFGRGAPAGRRR